MDSRPPHRLAALIRALGRSVYPQPAVSGHDVSIHLRIGLLTLGYALIGGVAAIISLLHVYAPASAAEPSLSLQAPGLLIASVVLAGISVFAPQAVFRTGATSSARAILDAPSVPIQPWTATTIRYNALVVGAMLAGLYLTAPVALLLVGVAYLIRTLVLNRVMIRRDANCRYHHLQHASSMMLIGAVAFAAVKPLASQVVDERAIAPLLLAGVAALYVGLALDALDRWARMDRTGRAVIRGAVDGRRFLVAVVSAGIAWLVAVAGESLSLLPDSGPISLPIVAALGIFLACWLLLWMLSISVWRSEGERTLRLWSTHQVRIAVRLADGSLSAELAGKAALQTTSRMAVVVFGATQAMTVHHVPSGGDLGAGTTPRQNTAIADRYERSPRNRLDAMASRSELRIPLSPTNSSNVTVWDCVAPGWFATRSRSLVRQFAELATLAMVTPSLPQATARGPLSFEAMFDESSGWPTMGAFLEAANRMAERFDREPSRASLVLGVYSIDEFPSLSGSRYEHAAIGQLMRAAVAHRAFAGRQVFVAYDPPGKVWVALSGGPVVRNSVQSLRDLQQALNGPDRGSLSGMDVDVLVTCSFGYAAHQVDALTTDGLVKTALDRLATDQAARNPFAMPDLSAFDLLQSQTIEADPIPVTVENLLELLAQDRGSERFVTELAAVRATQGSSVEALMLGVGWAREFRHLDMRAPETFLRTANRQPRLAALAAQVGLDALSETMAAADAASLTGAPVILRMPSILVHPEAGDLALPNLMVPFLDLRTSTRTVILLEEIPPGAGQAILMLVDRGLHVAVTAAAAAAADDQDLAGWPRWAIVFPRHVMQSDHGIDALTIQQTSSACAGQLTKLIGLVDGPTDRDALLRNDIAATIDLSTIAPSVDEALHPRVDQQRQRLHLTG